MLDFGFYNMDCLEGMKQFPDNYFDLAIVDPPYGSGNAEDGDKKSAGKLHCRFLNQKGVFSTQEEIEKNKKKIDDWDVAPGKEYFDELFRVSKNQIIWGGNYFDLPPTRCFLIWRKTNMPENFSMAMCEYAWTSFDQNAKVFECSSMRGASGGGFHPTEKPLKLYEWILSNYAKPGDLILDTHVGSASSLVACRNMNYKYVGFEIDADYYRKAKERVEKEQAQMNLWDFIGE